jgi:hypothetical protein
MALRSDTNHEISKRCRGREAEFEREGVRVLEIERNREQRRECVLRLKLAMNPPTSVQGHTGWILNEPIMHTRTHARTHTHTRTHTVLGKFTFYVN